jgi:hypothetical protein
LGSVMNYWRKEAPLTVHWVGTGLDWTPSVSTISYVTRHGERGLTLSRPDLWSWRCDDKGRRERAGSEYRDVTNNQSDSDQSRLLWMGRMWPAVAVWKRCTARWC